MPGVGNFHSRDTVLEWVGRASAYHETPRDSGTPR